MIPTAGGEAAPNQGQEFASLTLRGQLAYADFIADGYWHAEAFAAARYSYGVKPRVDSTHQSSVEWTSESAQENRGR